MIAIVFHSGYGHTEVQARAVARGVARTGTPRLVPVHQIEDHWDALAAADGLAFGAPTYMGSASAPFKAFMDASAARVWSAQRWRDKPAAGFTTSAWPSGDKLQTLVQLALFAMQHGMIWIGLDQLPVDGEAAPNRLGAWLGAMGRNRHGEAAPSEGDLASSEHLGARLARVADELRRGRAAGGGA